MKAALKTLVFHLVRLHLRWHDWVMRKLVRNFGKGQNLELLRHFLEVDHRTRMNVIARLGIPAYGVHPKNVFNYRKEFFAESVENTDLVLDIGCGSGRTLIDLAGKIGGGLGIDNQPPSRVDSAPNVRFLQADVLRVDYEALRKEFSYSVAIFSHILEHLENPSGLLRAVRAPRVLVCVPSEENWIARLKMELGVNHLTDPTHFREYSRDKLRKDLESAGYTEIAIGFNPEGELIGRGVCRE